MKKRRPATTEETASASATQFRPRLAGAWRRRERARKSLNALAISSRSGHPADAQANSKSALHEARETGAESNGCRARGLHTNPAARRVGFDRVAARHAIRRQAGGVSAHRRFRQGSAAIRRSTTPVIDLVLRCPRRRGCRHLRPCRARRVFATPKPWPSVAARRRCPRFTPCCRIRKAEGGLKLWWVSADG